MTTDCAHDRYDTDGEVLTSYPGFGFCAECRERVSLRGYCSACGRKDAMRENDVYGTLPRFRCRFCGHENR